jgi:transcriptional regulator with XRE-family HTH domain
MTERDMPRDTTFKRHRRLNGPPEHGKLQSMRLTPEQVGERIRAARLAKRWTHEELARQMEVNWRTVQRWQKGQLPRLNTLLRLAEVLGVPHTYFVEREDPLASMTGLRERVDELTGRVDDLAQDLARALASLPTAPSTTRPEPLARRVRA